MLSSIDCHLEQPKNQTTETLNFFLKDFVVKIAFSISSIIHI